jgi:hypothetical protein
VGYRQALRARRARLVSAPQLGRAGKPIGRRRAPLLKMRSNGGRPANCRNCRKSPGVGSTRAPWVCLV